MKKMKPSPLLFIFVFIALGFSVFGKEKSEYSVSSSGISKSEALSKAIVRAPYGFQIKKVHFNGYETRTKEGVINSNFKCRLIIIEK